MQSQKIIIIGASSGIGREMALRYLHQGCQVGVTGRRGSLLQEIKTKYPGNTFVSTFDVTGPENKMKLQALIDEMNGVDLLIYNAGYGEISDLPDWVMEEQTIMTNVLGFTEIVCHAFNYFCEIGSGQIAVISSVAGVRGSGFAPAYSASKSFMSNYAEGLNLKARKLKKNITVTDVRPGFINTKMGNSDRKFWVSEPGRAAARIMEAISKRKHVVYISSRWILIAFLLYVIPYGLYKRIS